MKTLARSASCRRVRQANGKLWLALAALGALTFAGGDRLAQAQSGMAVLTGVVRDGTDNKPLESVIVTATSPSLIGEQIALTDATGVYRIPNLPPGMYSIRFDLEKYFPNERKGFDLRSDTTVRINAQLARAEGEMEVVKVTEKAPTVDVG